MAVESARETEILQALIGGATVSFPTVREKFEALADVWDDANVGRAVFTLNHPAYHQIIAMGEAVVPLLLERLRGGEGVWVYALKCITGVQAEPPDAAGDPGRVINAWLEWGETTGRGSRGRL